MDNKDYFHKAVFLALALDDSNSTQCLLDSHWMIRSDKPEVMYTLHYGMAEDYCSLQRDRFSYNVMLL